MARKAGQTRERFKDMVCALPGVIAVRPRHQGS
jgi:hypothetical protein